MCEISHNDCMFEEEKHDFMCFLLRVFMLLNEHMILINILHSCICKKINTT